MTITPEEIARLRASHARISGASVGSGAAIYVLDEVPRLLDEIERLRAEAANWHNLRPVYAAAEREAAELRADLREAVALLRDSENRTSDPPRSVEWHAERQVRRAALLAKHKETLES